MSPVLYLIIFTDILSFPFSILHLVLNIVQNLYPPLVCTFIFIYASNSCQLCYFSIEILAKYFRELRSHTSKWNSGNDTRADWLWLFNSIELTRDLHSVWRKVNRYHPPYLAMKAVVTCWVYTDPMIKARPKHLLVGRLKKYESCYHSIKRRADTGTISLWHLGHFLGSLPIILVMIPIVSLTYSVLEGVLVNIRRRMIRFFLLALARKPWCLILVKPCGRTCIR